MGAIAAAVGRDPPRGRIPLWPVKAGAWLCETLCKPLKIEPPLHMRRLDFFTKDRGFTSLKAQREIGYSPRVSLADGLARTAAWYRQQGSAVTRRVARSCARALSAGFCNRDSIGSRGRGLGPDWPLLCGHFAIVESFT